MFEKNMKFPILLDTYGAILSERKREIIDYYYNEDYSLAEISEITGISRQGVRDSIKKSEEELYELEEKLKFLKKNEEVSQVLEKVARDLEEISRTLDGEASKRLESAVSAINRIRTTKTES